jgi:hypothetical protein
MKTLYFLLMLTVLPLPGGIGTTIRTDFYGPTTTQFISNPPGARIEIDGDYIGNAPKSYTWPRRYQTGERFSEEVRITAFPSGPKQYPQSKFYGNYPNQHPLIPERICFDMTLLPATSRSE